MLDLTVKVAQIIGMTSFPQMAVQYFAKNHFTASEKPIRFQEKVVFHKILFNITKIFSFDVLETSSIIILYSPSSSTPTFH